MKFTIEGDDGTPIGFECADTIVARWVHDVEYGARPIRRDIERILDATHELYEDIEYLGQGESSFIRKDLADLDAVGAFLKQLVRPQRADAAAKPGDATA
jgi:hypothetical protein